MPLKFPNYKQPDSKDCGPTCLKIISKHYGKVISLSILREICQTTREGSSLLNLSEAAERIGFRTIGVKISFLKLLEAPLPCILFWNDIHYVVLYEIKACKGGKSNWQFKISDPGHGLITYSKTELLEFWIGTNAKIDSEEGVALLLEPTPKFYNEDSDKKSDGFNFTFLSKYFLRHQKLLLQLFLGLIGSSLLQLILPFLTQSIVDVGIKNRDINFIYLILFAQLALFIGRSSIEIIRSWILLHLSTRINISLVSDFFIKLMSLPISYFDSRMTGDILQRINDHSRIEKILTTSSLNTLFSLLNFIVFGIVLAIYSVSIFSIFLIGSVLYFLWITTFLKKRRDLDYKRFSQISQEQTKVIELINGIQTIKLNNAEKNKRWGWEYLQARLYKIRISSLNLEQFQSVGSSFINEFKNIIITVLSAKLVIDGSITLGMMLAISYIVGQLNSPVMQLINFIKEFQDAKISLERLQEIHSKDNEETNIAEKIYDLPDQMNIYIENVSFKYPGSDFLTLNRINLTINSGKITAIVGASGSGKTTLMKLLLRIYSPTSGNHKIENINVSQISQRAWRENCGVVMQEDYIFNDTIANNIAVGVDHIEKSRLMYSVKVANIKEFIEKLPAKYNTKIGVEGVGLSTGQQQRLLIARAVYKDPSFLFFDEATSALDANNEKTIMDNLNKFFEGRTVVIVAHRLSTVRNADQIVVLHNGRICEIGNHYNLIEKQGIYYELVKNQLEIGR